MSKSNMSSIPGVGAMTDTLEMVKNMWGGMKIPGMAMPSLSVDDVNRQITDLRAVESWLTVNMNMLRGTIQALEVQSATLSALQSMSASMTAMVNPGAPPPAGKAAAPAEKFAYELPFSFSTPSAGKPSQPQPQPQPQPQEEQTQPEAVSAAPDKPAESGQSAAITAPFANPAAWWNLLQDQFKQVVSTAMVPEPAPAAPKAAVPAAGKPKTDAKPKAKPKAESKAAPAPAPRKSKPADGGK